MESVQKIPIRATVLSALSVVPYILVLVAIFALNLTYVERGIAVRIVFHIVDMIRCPLTTLVTFASNKKNFKQTSGDDKTMAKQAMCNEPSFSL